MERIQKAMARAGVASRRKCEQLILDGRVKVNGAVVDHLGAKIRPDRDRVELDGRVLHLMPEYRYIILNKPADVVTSVEDPFGRRTVIDLIPDDFPRLFPVGRLDKDTEGLLLLTNDGEMAYRLTHPRFKVPKTYVAELVGHPTSEKLNRLRAGIMLEDGRTAPAQVDEVDHDRGRTRLRITIWEGRKRQVRRMCLKIGHPVRKLRRVAFGPVRLGNLAKGGFRELSRTEVTELRRAVRLAAEPESRPRHHAKVGR